MSYQVFARKYRPLTFEDVLGQDHVVRTLRNAILQSRLAHAYLFVGPRGTGKTSTARIFAKALNCSNGPSAEFDPNEEICREIAEGNSLDVLEIDGASNNGVEQVRELRDNVKFAPARCRFKIYYIDEVHMLSSAAFNALLKTLEEPPAHVKFIFATTEPNKILPTIISRCQRFDLRRIPTPLIASHLLHIAGLEGVELAEKAAFAIGRGAEGGMRDAQSMLDQLVAFCGSRIEEKDVLDIFGFTGAETVAEMASCLAGSDTVGALRLVHEQSEAGKDLGRLLTDLIQHVRTVLVGQADPEGAVEDLAPEVARMVTEQAAMGTPSQFLRLVDGLAEVDARMRWSSNKRLHLELGVIQAVQHFNEVSLDDVIHALEEGGISSSTPRAARAAETPSRKVAVKGAAISADPQPMNKDGSSREAIPATEPIAEKPLATSVPISSGATQLVKPEAEPTPSVASPPEVAAVSDAEFWQALLTEVQKRRPLTLHWLQAATLLGLTATQVKVGFPISEESARDGLKRDTTRLFLEDVAAHLLGRKVKFDLVMDASLKEPDFTELTFGFADTTLSEPPALSINGTNGNGAKTPTNDALPEPSMAEDFYDDPLIKRAVERFKLKRIEDDEES